MIDKCWRNHKTELTYFRVNYYTEGRPGRSYRNSSFELRKLFQVKGICANHIESERIKRLSMLNPMATAYIDIDNIGMIMPIDVLELLDIC